MKKMKRLVAVLLAGMMALAMLTACGGGGSAPSNSLENQMVKYINITGGTSYSNDANMKSRVRSVLSKVDDNGYIAQKDLPYDKEAGTYCVSDYKVDTSTYTVSMTVYVLGSKMSDGSYKAFTMSEAEQKEFQEELANAHYEEDNLFTSMGSMKVEKLGVAVVEKNGKTYYGVAMNVSLNLGDYMG